MIYKADFHIHSCLSPCASLEMSPSAIVNTAVESGLRIIALTDHNSALNSETVSKICKTRKDFNCFFGMEVTVSEEVHCQVLFETLETVMDLNRLIDSLLPDVDNIPEKMGDQVFVDENEVILGEVSKYLGNAVDIGIEKLIEEVHLRNGLIIPSHIDRVLFGMIAQLGFVPEYDFDALELSKYYFKKSPLQPCIGAENFTLITGSDAHTLSDIGKAWLEVEAESFTFLDFKKALKNKTVHPIINF